MKINPGFILGTLRYVFLNQAFFQMEKLGEEGKIEESQTLMKQVEKLQST